MKGSASDALDGSTGRRLGICLSVSLRKAALISNVRPDGSFLTPEDFLFKEQRGNEVWHPDSTYMPLASKAGMLCAITVPSSGGETELAETRAAYDALDDDLKRQISKLSAYHSLYASSAKLGYVIETGSGYGYHTEAVPLRPLVKVHPVTGRNALCIRRHTYRIPGMDDAAALALLDALVEQACAAPRIYTHRWSPGDLVVWDNRCVLHRARPYDYNEPRVLRTTRIAGDPASDLASTDADERAHGINPSTLRS